MIYSIVCANRLSGCQRGGGGIAVGYGAAHAQNRRCVERCARPSTASSDRRATRQRRLRREAPPAPASCAVPMSRLCRGRGIRAATAATGLSRAGRWFMSPSPDFPAGHQRSAGCACPRLAWTPIARATCAGKAGLAGRNGPSCHGDVPRIGPAASGGILHRFGNARNGAPDSGVYVKEGARGGAEKCFNTEHGGKRVVRAFARHLVCPCPLRVPAPPRERASSNS